MAITIDREFKSLLFSGHTATSRALTALDTASKGKSLLADLAFSPDVSHDSSSTIGWNEFWTSILIFGMPLSFDEIYSIKVQVTKFNK